MKNSTSPNKILDYVRSATANTGFNPRRNASIGLSKLKQSQKLNPEVDVLYQKSHNDTMSDIKSSKSQKDIIFLNNRAYLTNNPKLIQHPVTP